MQAVITHPPGGLQHTRLEEVTDPVAGPEEVVVEIRAAALNPADAFLIEGSYPGSAVPPLTAGRDAAGIVRTADSAGLWAEGTPVVVLQSTKTDLVHGTLCERQRIAAENLARLPEDWSFAEGAAAPLVYQTAWQALVDRGRLQSGETVGVTGASGGVGLAAVQLARGLGATVVAFSRSEEKRRKLAEMGAQHVFSPEAEDLKRQVFAALGERGLDLVVENIGGRSLATSVHLLNPGGRVCVVGMLAGIEGSVPIPSLLFKQASIHGILVSTYTPSQAATVWNGILEVLQKQGMRPVIDSQFPLAQFERAFERLRSSPFGKVVIDMPTT